MRTRRCAFCISPDCVPYASDIRNFEGLLTSQRPPSTFSHHKRDEGGLFTTRAASGHAVSPRSRQRAARAAHTAPYSRQHVQGCVRGPEGRAGDPLPPVPDVQGERGGAQFLAEELQEDESREPRDAHLDQRGERRAGWHGGPLRYVADIRLDIETHASNSRGPSAVALFAASTRHPLHGSPRSIVANLEAFLADDARAEDFSHPSHPQISEWRRSFRWKVWTKRRLRRKSPPCSSRGAEEERRRVYDNNPTDRLE